MLQIIANPFPAPVSKAYNDVVCVYNLLIKGTVLLQIMNWTFL